MSSIYHINKGINKPVVFFGFKEQYIWYLGATFVGLLILFAVMYITGLHAIITLGIILISGSVSFLYIGRISHKYGEHGLQKLRAKKRVPRIIKSNSRKLFIRI